MNQETISDCLSKKSEHGGYIPNIDFSLFGSMATRISEMENTMLKMQEEQKMQQKRMDGAEKIIYALIDKTKDIENTNVSYISRVYFHNDILFIGCESGNVELVAYLLTRDKIDVNAENSNVCESNFMEFEWIFQWTALHLAVKNGNIEIVRLLLGCQGIDVNHQAIFSKVYLWHSKSNVLIQSKIKYFNAIRNQIFQ